MLTRRDFLKTIPAGALLYGLGRGAQAQGGPVIAAPQQAVTACLQDASIASEPHLYFWLWVNEEDPEKRAVKGAAASWAVNSAMATDAIVLPTPLYGGRLLRWSFWKLAGGVHERYLHLVKTWHSAFADNWVFNERFVLGNGKIVHVDGQHVQPDSAALYYRTGSWCTSRLVVDELGNERIFNFSPLVRWDHAIMVLTSQETALGGRYYDFRFGDSRDGKQILKDHGFQITENRERAYVADSKPALRKFRTVEINRDSGGGTNGDWMATWDISRAHERDPAFDPLLNLLVPKFDGTEVLFPLQNGLIAGFAGDAQFRLVDTVPDGIARDYICNDRLDGGIQSCVICHAKESKSIVCGFPNNLRDSQRGGVDVVFDLAALKKLGLTQEEAVQGLARMYAADLSDGSQLSLRIEFIHRVYERAVRQATGAVLTCETLAAALNEMRDVYRYTRYDAARMLSELGVQYQGDSLIAFKEHLPVRADSQELRVATLRGGGTLSPEVGRLVYRDCAVRVLAGADL